MTAGSHDRADDIIVPVSPAAGKETLAMLMGIFEAARVVPRAVATVSLPLTIVSGFLGSGKTTLVNRLLSEPGGRRIAVLVNDFAAVNIDEELIRFQSEDTIGLTNGCACCSINGDLVNAIQRLIERKEPPDAIVLEASGLADPRGIAQVALANPAIRLDAILTLVDCETFPERIRDERTRPTMLAQLSAADIIVMSKSDLIEDRRDAIKGLIELSASGRTILEAMHGNIPADIVLGVNASPSSAFRCSAADHHTSFASTTRSWSTPIQRDVIMRALRELPQNIIRAKGLFCFKDDERRRFVYQRVGKRESLEAAPELSWIAQHGSRLVLIGFSDQWDEAEVSRLIP
ncbi:GTP-binding protein [Bradyrhizobium sp. Arg237L]|uniref:CobW family GTP-binding protein n=1 Tax=Bradyrhizobium sp. Arg237L TaxID=3003352 RepID=UPI00249F4553|nr:GTP-binding protein [Bradyrhizobium sp. Arg237L]MDI4235575.1 GTP-binding protein [Bradyrhizobium sp. Arg237L]